MLRLSRDLLSRLLSEGVEEQNGSLFMAIRRQLISIRLVFSVVTLWFIYLFLLVGLLCMESGKITKLLLTLLLCVLLLVNTQGGPVPLTLLKSAVSKGAVCLDGSPPAYHFDKGFGEGIHNWIVYIEGGGWCSDVNSCLSRKDTNFGSSNKMPGETYFSGFLSNEQQYNPDFFNWNRVKVRYCDGGSFTGDVEEVDPTTNLHFRGARIFVAVIEDLLAKGLKDAKNAILSGCSAGGLTTILHCDQFKSLLPAATKVKCVADAGYFVNVKDISGAQYIEDYFSDVVKIHGSAKNLPSSCTSKLSPELCFFPQNAASSMNTPLFILNAVFDSWQISYILAPVEADHGGLWTNCKTDINKCSPDQLSRMQGFRKEFVSALGVIGNSSSNGMFIDSCFVHCQAETQEEWFSAASTMLANTPISKAVGDWFYERRTFKEIDCPYPCNPTCHNHV